MRTTPLALAFAALLLHGACGGPDINTNRSASEAGIDFNFDGGGPVFDDSGAAPPVCPDNIPKVGESCGPGTNESTSCEFNQGECLAPNGMSYVETAIYCCPDGVWEACGGASPCDNFVDAGEPPPPVDAGVGDASGDGPDGGIDTAPVAD
jgi:hypothetical protein